MVHPLGLVNSRWDPLLEDQGAYKSQKSQALWGNKGHTSRTSRKPFGGPKGLPVAKSKPFGDQGAYMSQAFWGTNGLTSRKVAKVASPFGEKGAYKSQKSQALWKEQGAYKSQKS